MTTTFFKTEAKMDRYIRSMTTGQMQHFVLAEPKKQICLCGRSAGVNLRRVDNGKRIGRAILCPHCFSEVEYDQQGETW
jgi:hypothetical protein